MIKRNGFGLVVGASCCIVLAGCSGSAKTDGSAARTEAANQAVQRMTSPDLSEEQQREVEQFLRQGQSHLGESRWLDAADAYAAALEIDPSNDAARRGLSEARARFDRASLLPDAAREFRLRHDRAIAEFDAAIVNAADAVMQNRFEEARAHLLQARAELARRQMYVSNEEYEVRDRRAAELLSQVNEARELFARLNDGR